jgi:hypothetical protein
MTTECNQVGKSATKRSCWIMETWIACWSRSSCKRTRTHYLRSSQLRLYFSSIAYVLLQMPRRLGLAGTELPLPSPGVTRLHRYCEPLRRPSRPGPSLASCQLILTAITVGASRVASDPLYPHAVATTPAGSMETCSLVYSHRLRPSPNLRRVGHRITLFRGPLSVHLFTAHRLAKSPSRPSAPKASASSATASIATGWNEPATGRDSHPLWIRAFFTAH